jgi:hypothetical protein
MQAISRGFHARIRIADQNLAYTEMRARRGQNPSPFRVGRFIAKSDLAAWKLIHTRQSAVIARRASIVRRLSVVAGFWL